MEGGKNVAKNQYIEEIPTYVSCCCSIESKKLWFFVPGQKLRELG